MDYLEKIYNLLCKALGKRQGYSYTFKRYNELSKVKQITIQNALEYEFINSGSMVVVLNDNLRLYPEFIQRGSHRQKFVCNKNEMDLTIYDFRFEIIPIGGAAVQLSPATLAFQLTATYNLDGTALNIGELQVIVKQISKDTD